MKKINNITNLLLNFYKKKDIKHVECFFLLNCSLSPKDLFTILVNCFLYPACHFSPKFHLLIIYYLVLLFDSKTSTYYILCYMDYNYNINSLCPELERHHRLLSFIVLCEMNGWSLKQFRNIEHKEEFEAWNISLKSRFFYLQKLLFSLSSSIDDCYIISKESKFVNMICPWDFDPEFLHYIKFYSFSSWPNLCSGVLDVMCIPEIKIYDHFLKYCLLNTNYPFAKCQHLDISFWFCVCLDFSFCYGFGYLDLSLLLTFESKVSEIYNFLQTDLLKYKDLHFIWTHLSLDNDRLYFWYASKSNINFIEKNIVLEHSEDCSLFDVRNYWLNFFCYKDYISGYNRYYLGFYSTDWLVYDNFFRLLYIVVPSVIHGADFINIEELATYQNDFLYLFLQYYVSEKLQLSEQESLSIWIFIPSCKFKIWYTSWLW